MGLKAMAEAFAKSRTMMILIALVTTFAGVALLIDPPKGTVLEWLSLPLLVLGGGLFALALWPASYNVADASESLASRVLGWLTFEGRLVNLFPALGVGIIIADLVYNWTASATPALQTEDTIVLLGAGCLLGYGFVPDRFARERDFVLLFFILLNAILVVPLLIARVYYADLEKSVDVYSWIALAPQTSALLTLLGVSNQLHAVAGSTAPGLTFTPEHLGVQVTIVITTACSGIYSFGIFASAFVAFILTEFQRPARRVWLLLGLGMATAYVANVLRMVIIVLVGYYTDTTETDLQNMLLAHSYAGWLIFLGWIVIFWGVLFKFLTGTSQNRNAATTSKAGSRPQSTCHICSEVLTPAITATRCECGSYYHRKCLDRRSSCPNCGRPTERNWGLVAGGD